MATKAKTSGAPATAGCGDSREMMSPEKREEALERLARASGQVAGISRMIDDSRHCTEVLQQIAAVQKALDAVGNIVLRDHLERCVTPAVEGGDPLVHDELVTVLTRCRKPRTMPGAVHRSERASRCDGPRRRRSDRSRGGLRGRRRPRPRPVRCTPAPP